VLHRQDYECVTVLSQGHVPALQVLNSSGEWVLATPIPGTLVVNIADCLAIWYYRNEKTLRNITVRH
jgi:isopenicillin N synthase-like dioxygenase